jgi:hypothetical protein
MFCFAQTQLEIGRSVILDNAFHPELASARVQALARQTGANTLQIICDADSKVLFERFRRRAESGLRHEGHVDMLSLDELEARLKQEPALRLDIGGQVLQVDTTDWATVCYETILDEVVTVVENARQA